MLSSNSENISWLIAPGVIPGGTSGDILGEIYRGIPKEFMDQCFFFLENPWRNSWWNLERNCRGISKEKSEVIFGGNYGKNP